MAACVLQRTEAKSALRVFDALIRRYPSAADLAAANVDDVRALFEGAGLLKRANYLWQACRHIIAHHGGRVPRRKQALLTLPGVGEYIASATSVLVGSERAAIVDGPTSRVLRRVFGLPSEKPGKSDRQLARLANDILPRRRVKDYNLAILDLAEAVCISGIPRCQSCPVSSVCAHRHRAAGEDQSASPPVG